MPDQLAQVLLHVADRRGELVHLVAAEEARALGGERLRQIAAADLERAAIQARDPVRHLLEADRDGEGDDETEHRADQRMLGGQVIAHDLVGEDPGEDEPQGQIADQDLAEEAYRLGDAARDGDGCRTASRQGQGLHHWAGNGTERLDRRGAARLLAQTAGFRAFGPDVILRCASRHFRDRTVSRRAPSANVRYKELDGW